MGECTGKAVDNREDAIYYEDHECIDDDYDEDDVDEEVEDEDDDDSCSDQSSTTSTSTSNNQRVDGGRVCDCCYCEVFGHGMPAVAPTSRNYNEMRERLRSRLNKRKAERGRCENAANITNNAPERRKELVDKEDNRDLEELLSYIEGTSRGVSKTNKGKKKKEKKKKKDKQNRKISDATSSTNTSTITSNNPSSLNATQVLSSETKNQQNQKLVYNNHLSDHNDKLRSTRKNDDSGPNNDAKSVGMYKSDQACVHHLIENLTRTTVNELNLTDERTNNNRKSSPNMHKKNGTNESNVGSGTSNAITSLKDDKRHRKSSDKSQPNCYKSDVNNQQLQRNLPLSRHPSSQERHKSPSLSSQPLNHSRSHSSSNVTIPHEATKISSSGQRCSNGITFDFIRKETESSTTNRFISTTTVGSGNKKLQQRSSKTSSTCNNESFLTPTNHSPEKINGEYPLKESKKRDCKLGKGRDKKNNEDIVSPDEVFLPKSDIDLENGELDEIEKEVEAFKRFCFNSVPRARKDKVNVNLKDILIKRRPLTNNFAEN